ncbi:MAG: hypothetical protein IJY12_04770 [Clostridia bacterium]|nr:hypothetical protein [Clostridia bacterium]
MNGKKLGKHFLFPPLWVMILMTLLSAFALVLVFVRGASESPIAYAVYVLAFYALTVDTLFCVKVVPKKYRDVKQRIYDHPLGHRYMTDAVFRTHVSLALSLGINLLYVGVNGVSFFLYRSAWYVILALYYGTLAVMRYLLLRYAHGVGIGQDYAGELRRTVLCSFILLTVNFALTGSVLMILYQGRGKEAHGILIYVMAMYTFYVTIHAIVSLVRHRKYKSPVITFTKVIALSAALVSMLSLETAMLSQFGAEMSQRDERIMIALTGAGVSVTVITMSVYIIVRSLKDIKSLRSDPHGKQ